MAYHHEDALPVKEAELATLRRIGAPEAPILVVQGNLASTYACLGRRKQALSMRRDVYSGWLKLKGEEHHDTLREANNLARGLNQLLQFAEVKSLMLKTVPTAWRVLGESHDLTLSMRCCYGEAIYADPAATLDDLREAVATLEDTERITRRVLGGAHPITARIERALRESRAVLRIRDTPPANA